MVEQLTADIMGTLERMSNDALAWINNVVEEINQIVDEKARNKQLKELRQAEILLHYSRNRLQTKFFLPGSKAGKQATDKQAFMLMKQDKLNVSEVCSFVAEGLLMSSHHVLWRNWKIFILS